MTGILFVAGMVVWLVAVVSCGMKAADAAWEERGVITVGAWSLATLVLFAVPVGLIIDPFESGDETSGRCLRGHQEWRTTHTAPLIVGKTILPGGSYQSKVWLCDEREAR